MDLAASTINPAPHLPPRPHIHPICNNPLSRPPRLIRPLTCRPTPEIVPRATSALMAR